MGQHLDPTLRQRLVHHEEELRKRKDHCVRYYADVYYNIHQRDTDRACHGRTIANGMAGIPLHPNRHPLVAAFADWLENYKPWLLQAYTLHCPSYLHLDFEAVLRSNDRDYRSGVADILYKQSFFYASAKILAGTAVLYAAERELQQQAKVLRMQASCAVFVNDHRSADQLLSEAAEVSREAGDLIGQLDAEAGLAFNNFQRGDHGTAQEKYAAIWKRAENHAEKHDATCFGCCCYGMGRVIERSDPKEAIRLHRLGLGAFESNEIGLGNCHYGLGLAYLQLEDWEKAEQRFEEAERHFRNMGNNLGIAECSEGLADLASKKR